MLSYPAGTSQIVTLDDLLYSYSMVQNQSQHLLSNHIYWRYRQNQMKGSMNTLYVQYLMLTSSC